MSATFSYPTTATPIIVFSMARFTGDLATLNAHQDRDQTDSGEMASYTYGNGYIEYPLTVIVPKATQSGTTASVALLQSFCQSTVDWGAHPFYYTDPDGANHLVKLLNTSLAPEADYVNHVKYKLTMREEL